MFTLLVLDDFFDSETRIAILHELEAANGAEAEVYGRSAGGAVDTRTRSAKKLAASPSIREMVWTALGNVQRRL